MSARAYFLVGATASGKSDVAHILSRRMSLPILSIDSMQVYEGLDIGTAKPSPEERSSIRYYGLDLVTPDQDFSLARFCNYVRTITPEIERGVIVCGGTGLYAKALTEGLSEGPPPDEALRAKWADVIKNGRLDELRKELRSVAPKLYESLRDKENPRRLIRALEKANAGLSGDESWDDGCSAPMTGLERPVEDLKKRIELRASMMFDSGLVAETRRVKTRFGFLSRTAAQAIGYAEALALIEGSISEAEAVAAVQARTRRLAKKQRTWFRHQANVDWVACDGSLSLEELADLVQQSWDEHGPVDICSGEGK